MKYVIWPKDKPIVHNVTGIANTQNIFHVRRKAVFTELMIMIEGTMHIKHIKEYTLQKGDIFILPQNIEHYGTKPSSFIVQWSHFILPIDFQIVDESMIDSTVLNKYYAIPIHAKISNVSNISTLSYQLEQYPILPSTQHIRDALMSAILYDIAYQFSEQHLNNIVHNRLNSIINFINCNIFLPISIKEISEKFNYNEKYIFNLFKKHLNISPLQYIIQQKMNIAKNMLLSTNNTIEAIAISLSYDNPQYFMRLFKKTFGYTPSEFRKSYTNSIELYLREENNI